MNDFFKRTDYTNGIENFLLMNLNQYQFVLGADIEHYAKTSGTFDGDPCNIYFVLTRPKVTVDPNSVEINGNMVKLDFIVHDPGNYQSITLRFNFERAKSELSFHSEYPHNLFSISDKTGTIFGARPGALIDSDLADNDNMEFLDYQVLYIGQAYGKNGERTAIDRLKSHETVQKIYAHASAHNPDFDIWFMLANFSEQNVSFHLPRDVVKKSRRQRKNDDLKMDHLEKNGMLSEEKQKLNFTEAALIRYFEPPYNKDFKSSFPSRKHKSYKDCYELDIKALIVEIDTSENTRRIYSDTVKRSHQHLKMFEFNSDDDRLNLLGFFDSLEE